jgi:hypothetical protein
MKVLIFGPFAALTPHLETDLEIAQRHLDEGDEVMFLGCNSELMACEINSAHNFKSCIKCMSRRKRGISLLSQNIIFNSFYNLSETDKHELVRLKLNFSSVEELKDYKIDNFDIGIAVLSSIIWLTRDPIPKIEAHDGLIKRLLISAFAVYRSLQNYLDKTTFDRVYIFNGRLAIVRAAVRACESKHIKFFTHERGNDLQHYALYDRSLPHDLIYGKSEILKQWELAGLNPERNKIAAQFYLENRDGVVQSWYSYIKDQKENLLPPNWNRSKLNIAIFNSSEDEFAAIDDTWTNPLYRNQLEGLNKIVRSLSGNSGDIHLYLRVHPNLKSVDNDYLRSLLAIESEILTIIPADSPVSTYALLAHADKVLTFGSTVGIEAVYWGKPSISAGQAFYRDLGGTYNPGTHEELIELLKADLEPKGKEAALMYGYYMKTFGVPFKYFRATGVFGGEFKGEVIEGGRWTPTILRTSDAYQGFERFASSLIRLYTNVKLLPIKLYISLLVWKFSRLRYSYSSLRGRV